MFTDMVQLFLTFFTGTSSVPRYVITKFSMFTDMVQLFLTFFTGTSSVPRYVITKFTTFLNTCFTHNNALL